MARKVIDGWVSVFETGTDYEANIVRDRLKGNDIDAVVMSKHDRSFNINVGAISRLYVLVQPEVERRAINILHQLVPSDEELARLALDADPEDVEPPSGSVNTAETK